jgi:hypothetical protein
VSALTGHPVKANVAMTGEITLRWRSHGDRRPEGEAARGHRGGITTVLIPRRTSKDLQDIPENVKNISRSSRCVDRSCARAGARVGAATAARRRAGKAADGAQAAAPAGGRELLTH